MAEQPVEVTLEDDQPEEQPSTPLGQVAAIMVKMIDSAPDTEAWSESTLIYTRSEGVTVKMAVLSVSADTELVTGQVLEAEPVQPE